MRNKKKIVIGILCAIVMVMTVGYALLAQELNINGRASIDSTWQVEITKVTSRDIVGGASSKETTSYTSTTATLDIGLIQPGDSITYDIEVTNKGTLDAVVESINVSMEENEAISYTTNGIIKGDKITKNGGKKYLTIKIEYNSEITSQPTNIEGNLIVAINCEQDLGQVVVYDAYSVGDIVTFAGSNWYVIKNSTIEEDYVTLMKENVLTNDELGEYSNNYGMPYYWSDTCHDYGVYGYTDYDYSGCEGHNDYEGSKVREFLEGTYINKLGADNLKEVDGYKIRLVSTDDLNQNLGWVNVNDTIKTDNDNANVQKWVYQNTGGWYWTMSPSLSNLEQVSEVRVVNSVLLQNISITSNVNVRPVINLLKSNI